MKTKYTAAYGANGTKAAPAANSTGKDLETEQGKLPDLKTAVETANGNLKTLEDAKKAFDADSDTNKTATLAALNKAAKAVDSNHQDWDKDNAAAGYGAVLTKAQGAVTTAEKAVTEQNKKIADAKAAHDKAEAELSEARKGALLDYAATLEKAAADIKSNFAADTPTAEEKAKYNAAKMKAAKSGHDVAKAIDTAKTALDGEKTKKSSQALTVQQLLPQQPLLPTLRLTR